MSARFNTVTVYPPVVAQPLGGSLLPGEFTSATRTAAGCIRGSLMIAQVQVTSYVNASFVFPHPAQHR